MSSIQSGDVNTPLGPDENPTNPGTAVPLVELPPLELPVEAANSLQKATVPVDLGEGSPKPPEAPPEPSVARVEYNRTGVHGYDLALAQAGKLGLGPDHPAVQAASKGDFTKLLKEFQKADVEHADLVIEGAADGYQREREKQVTLQRYIADTAIRVSGSPEKWQEVFDWTIKNTDEQQKAEISDGLNRGGVSTLFFSMGLNNLYQQYTASQPPPVAQAAPVNTGDPKPVSKKNSPASSSQSDMGPLSPQQYGKAVAKLKAKYTNGTYQESQEYADLQARRRMSK